MGYTIKDWKKFQHFKDRRPPWIKLYKELIDDVEYHSLDAEAAKYLVLLWLIASEDKELNGTLPDINQISFRLRLTKEHVTKILGKLTHWIVNDDINVISSRHQDDTPEKRREEAETKKEFCSSFEQLWKEYPDKSGKHKAYIAYKKWIKEGDTNDEIEFGIRAYIYDVATKRKTGFGELKYKNGATFFTQRVWKDYDKLKEIVISTIQVAPERKYADASTIKR